MTRIVQTMFSVLAIGALTGAIALAHTGGFDSKIEIDQLRPSGRDSATISGKVESDNDPCEKSGRKVKVIGVYGGDGTKYLLGKTRTSSTGKWSEELEGPVEDNPGLMEAFFPKYIAKVTKKVIRTNGHEHTCRGDKDTIAQQF